MIRLHRLGMEIQLDFFPSAPSVSFYQQLFCGSGSDTDPARAALSAFEWQFALTFSISCLRRGSEREVFAQSAAVVTLLLRYQMMFAIRRSPKGLT